MRCTWRFEQNSKEAKAVFLSFFLVSFLQCAGPTKQVTPGNPLLELPSPDQDSIWAAPEAFLRFPTSQATINSVIAAVAGDNGALEEPLLPGDTSGVPVAPEDDEEDDGYEDRLWQTKEREACKKFWGCTTQGKNSTEWDKVPFWSSAIKALEDMQTKARSLSPIEQAVSFLLRWMQGSTSGSYLPDSDRENGLFFETLYPPEPKTKPGFGAWTKNMLRRSFSSQASPPLLFDAQTDEQEVTVQDLEVLKLLIRATWAKEQAEKPWLLEHYFSLIRDKIRAVPITATSRFIQAWYAENESDYFENAGFKGIGQYINNPGIGSLVRKIRNCIIIACCVGGAASYLMLKTQATSPRSVSVLPVSALTSVLRPVCGSRASSHAFSSQSLGTQVGETVYFQASDNSAPAVRVMHSAGLQQDLATGDFLRSAYGLVTAHQDCNFLTAVFEAIRHLVPAYTQITVTFYNNGLGRIAVKTPLTTSSIPAGVSFHDSATTSIAPNCIYVGGGELKSDDSGYRMPSALPGQVVVVVIPNLAIVSSSPAVDAPPKETTRLPTISVAPIIKTKSRSTRTQTFSSEFETKTLTGTSSSKKSTSKEQRLQTDTRSDSPSLSMQTFSGSYSASMSRALSVVQRLAGNITKCLDQIKPWYTLDGWREFYMDPGNCSDGVSYFANTTLTSPAFMGFSNGTAGDFTPAQNLAARIAGASPSAIYKLISSIVAAQNQTLASNLSVVLSAMLPLAIDRCLKIPALTYTDQQIQSKMDFCMAFCLDKSRCPSCTYPCCPNDTNSTMFYADPPMEPILNGQGKVSANQNNYFMRLHNLGGMLRVYREGLYPSLLMEASFQTSWYNPGINFVIYPNTTSESVFSETPFCSVPKIFPSLKVVKQPLNG